MSRHIDIIESHGLTLIRNLQDTEFKTVDLMWNAAGEPSVLKYCKTHCPSLTLEKEVLVAVNVQPTTYLTFPKMLGFESDYLLMSFVDREDQTRDTITDRAWPDTDIEVLSRGLKEFLSLTVPSSIYTTQQKLMGLVYPTFKLLLSIPKLIKRRCLSLFQTLKLIAFALRYCLHRPFIRYRTTHYDMTTLNCAFSGKDKLSILDLELGYAGGDPFFDICYFLTIPPIALSNWTFQRRALSHFMKDSEEHAVKFRVRFILLVCIVSRLLHFDNGSKEHLAYKDSMRTLLSCGSFNSWWSAIVQVET